eukprot:GFUD01019544.1.p1 GENE.GFUD01019544.1~~GFUD01019544.1.p1  ORF type:complete len:652 (-),score=157.53 GFUD01019544.1:80-1963(-)
MEKDVTKEDPKIILPQFSVELLQACTDLIYTGSTPITDVVTVGNMLELMDSIGLNMPVNCLLLVAREDPTDVEMVGFKTHSGLDITEVNNIAPDQPVPSDKGSLEITISPRQLTKKIKHRRMSKVVQKLTPNQKGLTTICDKSREAGYKVNDKSSIGDLEPSDRSEVTPKAVGAELVPLLINLECEEPENLDDFGDFQQTKKRKWSRRSETLQILTHNFDFCDFKCRFKKDLQEHCDLHHSDKEFICPKCDFKTSGLALIKIHEKKRHIGLGVIVCEVCGFRARNKRKMTLHKSRFCPSQGKEIISVDLKTNGSQNCPNLPDIGSLVHENLNVETEAVSSLEKSPKVCDTTDNPAENKLENNEAADKETSNEQSPDEKVTSEASSGDQEVDEASNLYDTKLSEVNSFLKDFCNVEKDFSEEPSSSSCSPFDTVLAIKECVVTNEDDESDVSESIESLLKEIPVTDENSHDVENTNDMIDGLENYVYRNIITESGEKLGFVGSGNRGVIDVMVMDESESVDVIDDFKEDSSDNFADLNVGKVIDENASNEVTGFRCSVPACSREVRLSKNTTATCVLNRLRTHHANVHDKADVSEFSYTILYKEATKDIMVSKKKKEAKSNANLYLFE